MGRQADSLATLITAPVAEIAEAVSPVPGGVGPLTVAMLLENTFLAAKERKMHVPSRLNNCSFRLVFNTDSQTILPRGSAKSAQDQRFAQMEYLPRPTCHQFNWNRGAISTNTY